MYMGCLWFARVVWQADVPLRFYAVYDCLCCTYYLGGSKVSRLGCVAMSINLCTLLQFRNYFLGEALAYVV